MSGARQRGNWTWDAYLEWEAGQPIRYELVDGEVYAMTGGTTAHDIVCNNLRGELRTQLHGKPCRSQGPDLKVKVGRNGRYPDALVDRGPLVLDAQVAQEPVAVFEVLSKSTAWIDQGLKLRDYDSAPSIRYYVLINQDEMRGLVYTRDESGRLGIQNAALLEGAAAVVEIPECGVVPPFGALYERLTIS